MLFSCGTADCDFLPPVLASISLGPSLSTRSPSHFESKASVSSALRLDSSSSPHSLCRLELSSSPLRALTLGSALPLPDVARLSLPPSARSLARCGAAPSTLDFATADASLPLKSLLRCGFSASSYGQISLETGARRLSVLGTVTLDSSLLPQSPFRCGSPLLTSQFAHFGALLPLKAFSQVGFLTSILGPCSSDSSLLALDVHLGSSSSPQSFSCSDLPTLLLGSSHIGSTPSLRSPARLGSGSFLSGVSRLGLPISCCNSVLLGASLSLRSSAHLDATWTWAAAVQVFQSVGL